MTELIDEPTDIEFLMKLKSLADSGIRCEPEPDNYRDNYKSRRRDERQKQEQSILRAMDGITQTYQEFIEYIENKYQISFRQMETRIIAIEEMLKQIIKERNPKSKEKSTLKKQNENTSLQKTHKNKNFILIQEEQKKSQKQEQQQEEESLLDDKFAFQLEKKSNHSARQKKERNKSEIIPQSSLSLNFLPNHQLPQTKKKKYSAPQNSLEQQSLNQIFHEINQIKHSIQTIHKVKIESSPNRFQKRLSAQILEIDLSKKRFTTVAQQHLINENLKLRERNNLYKKQLISTMAELKNIKAILLINSINIQ